MGPHRVVEQLDVLEDLELSLAPVSKGPLIHSILSDPKKLSIMALFQGSPLRDMLSLIQLATSSSVSMFT